MNIHRKICVVFSNFVFKIIGGINLGKKSFLKIVILQVSITTYIKRHQTNTYNQSNENKMVTQNIVIKSKTRFS